jgi:adenylate cyclase
MGQDEHATLAALTACRDVFSRLVGQFHGRIVNAPGDSVLAEFGSVVDAVGAAVEIQRELAERNAEEPGGRRMDFRIGVNLGDVLVKDDDLYGDGVNIAARIQALAELGGISISGSVYDAVRGKLPLEFDFRGEQRVKNIGNPVRTYRVLSRPGAAAHRVVRARRTLTRHWRRGALALVVLALIGATALLAWKLYLAPLTPAPPAAESAGLPLPEQPSIAVLPFVNMSGDPEQEYFADGITETLITDLSRVPNLFVIARNSTFRYKRQPVDVRQIGKELGVLHVLEGSVQQSQGRVRINVQLTNARDGTHVWAERYDRDETDIFKIQDEIALQVVTELDVQLVAGQQARLWRRGNKNPEAYNLYLKGRSFTDQFTRQSVSLARDYYLRALALDPDLSMAVVWLAWTFVQEVDAGWTDDPQRSLDQLKDVVLPALRKTPVEPELHQVAGEYYMRLRQFDRALAQYEAALRSGINNAESLLLVAWNLAFLGRAEQAVELARQALRTNPYPPDWHYGGLAAALAMSGRLAEAISVYHKCADRVPDLIWCQAGLAEAYSLTGQFEKARLHGRELLRVNPKITAQANEYVLQIPDAARRAVAIDSLRKAGLP